MAAKKPVSRKAARATRSTSKKPPPKLSPAAGRGRGNGTLKPAAKTTAAASCNGQWRKTWIARHKAYAQVFGPAFPKGQVLLAEGECIAPAAACRRNLSFMQYPPRPDRLGWIYVTHGLSQACAKGKRALRIELALHWRGRDNKAAVGVLAQAAKYMLESGTPISPGAVLSSQEVPSLGVSNLRHWLACEPDSAIPARIEHSGVCVHFVLLLGISDAELQCALRVNPALADGRQVLLEALQCGGVFPMSDPERTCLTRRSDFHRLWERSFQTVRERITNGEARNPKDD